MLVGVWIRGTYMRPRARRQGKYMYVLLDSRMSQLHVICRLSTTLPTQSKKIQVSTPNSASPRPYACNAVNVTLTVFEKQSYISWKAGPTVLRPKCSSIDPYMCV